MTRPGIEPRSTEPLANTLTIMPMYVYLPAVLREHDTTQDHFFNVDFSSFHSFPSRPIAIRRRNGLACPTILLISWGELLESYFTHKYGHYVK